jgi:hypothetical protein
VQASKSKKRRKQITTFTGGVDMKLMSYSEALKLGKDAIKETLIPVRVNKAKKTSRT